ncbi:TnsA-like heteromeric transposase endonuclease subunit [Streptomyces sp. ISL-86]|uniref:TnsA-like heteromeric transposase endonuclease subunit n=1 Tax=Streptomyces sp. ISL-86 TaxID=2819187 RepID=UPI001BEC7674|nr:TnsA-like heteromeric transposase endonuclease subunit [Streptomyces sp. ISL-86]MBT2458635.1 TnsA-like heteromeric transposase endonuclease subunit [Streptomyces sp. ISL-86]
MAEQSAKRGRFGAGEPVAWVRYEDGGVLAHPVGQLRLKDFLGSVPWRQVRSRHGDLHFSGSYASATMGAFVVHESRLELARLLLADFDPLVHRIYAQPFRLVARVETRTRHHVPDYLLVSASGTARLVNVKPAERLADPKIAEALAWPSKIAERHGWEYEIWSGADVVFLENVRFLAAYRRPGVVPEEEVARAWASVHDEDTLADAERRLAGAGPRHEVRPPLMALLWSGKLTTDLTRPLSGDSVLRRAA